MLTGKTKEFLGKNKRINQKSVVLSGGVFTREDGSGILD